MAWGARLGGTTALFTTHSAPVMTRLRQPERLVLDTLVDAGVARSRSDALAWAVRLVGEHADSWLGELREAMSKVDDLRSKGPTWPEMPWSDSPRRPREVDRCPEWFVSSSRLLARRNRGVRPRRNPRLPSRR